MLGICRTCILRQTCKILHDEIIIAMKHDNINQLHDLWNPDVQCRIHKDSPIVPILSRINQISRIDTCFFKIHFSIVLPSTPRPFYGLGILTTYNKVCDSDIFTILSRFVNASLTVDYLTQKFFLNTIGLSICLLLQKSTNGNSRFNAPPTGQITIKSTYIHNKFTAKGFGRN